MNLNATLYNNASNSPITKPTKKNNTGIMIRAVIASNVPILSPGVSADVTHPKETSASTKNPPTP